MYIHRYYLSEKGSKLWRPEKKFSNMRRGPRRKQNYRLIQKESFKDTPKIPY
jgi:hypothetical protein